MDKYLLSFYTNKQPPWGRDKGPKIYHKEVHIMYYLVYSSIPTSPYYPWKCVGYVIGMDHLRGLARCLVPWPIPCRASFQEIADILAMYNFEVYKLTKAEITSLRPQDVRLALEGLEGSDTNA